MILSDPFVCHTVVTCTCDKSRSEKLQGFLAGIPSLVLWLSTLLPEWSGCWLQLRMRASASVSAGCLAQPCLTAPTWDHHTRLATLQGTLAKSWWSSNISSMNPEEKPGFSRICWDRVMGWVGLVLCYLLGLMLPSGTCMQRRARYWEGHLVRAMLEPVTATQIDSTTGHSSWSCGYPRLEISKNVTWLPFSFKLKDV